MAKTLLLHRARQDRRRNLDQTRLHIDDLGPQGLHHGLLGKTLPHPSFNLIIHHRFFPGMGIATGCGPVSTAQASGPIKSQSTRDWLRSPPV